MTSESEDRIMSKSGVDSPAAEETSNGENTGSSVPLKKGPWTTTEDAILMDYVTKHGEGNWNAVQKHSGLARCGKSCRLRWANHLRPDLKKGAFTPEEECRIIELHAKMGNKWARMATELPGRTDNEIKNYWNTRIKRRQRAGLPIYPPEICLHSVNKNQQSEEMGHFSSGNAQHSDFFPINNFEIPAVEFKNLELNQQLYPSAYLDIPASSLLDIPASSLPAQGLDSSTTSKSMFTTMHPSKRLRGSEPLFPGLCASFNGVLPACNQYQSDGSEQIAQSFGFSSAYDHTLAPEHPSSSRVLPGSHALLNSNFSSSEPTSWAMKLELPSLQTQIGNWGSPSSPLASLESVDTLIQSPPTEHTGSGSLSPRNSGLLDAVLYESQTIKNFKTNSCQQTSASVSPCDLMDNSSQDLHETEWEGYGDPISPLGHTAASVFNEHTPNSGGSSGEHQSLNTMPGCKVKQEAVDLAPLQSIGKNEASNEVIDVLLGSNCFSPGRENGRESFQAESCNWGTSW